MNEKNMREKLEQIINEWGKKHWSFGLRRHPDVLAWVLGKTTKLPEDASLAMRAYCALHDVSPICHRGNLKKLKSVFDGFAFCGTAGKCECAREQVSTSVAATKAAMTPEEIAAANAKREATSLSRYNVRNNGQTEHARERHREFYASQDNKAAAVQALKVTMLVKYNVENPIHHPEINGRRVATLHARHGVTNPMQHKSIAAKSLATRLDQGYARDYYRRNYDRLVDRLLEDHKLRVLTPFEEYTGVASRPLFKLECAECSHPIEWRVDYGYFPRCNNCNPPTFRRKSTPELEMLAFVREDLGIADAESGNRSMIAPLELDIVCHGHRVAIEHCGLYYHAEWCHDQKYHLNKLDRTNALGYRLITVYGDEWQERREIVKSRIRVFLNLCDRRVYARQTELTPLSFADASAFYDAHHMQGSAASGVNYGLIHNGDIVAAMSFTSARASQNLGANAFDLNRFACRSNTVVVGGASRLFKHFVKTHTPTQIVSYADRRWSDGEIYRQLGFELKRIGPPRYDYIEPGYAKRFFRFHFRKSELAKAGIDMTGKTEWEVMRALGYDRIWDCGRMTFVWKAT